MYVSKERNSNGSGGRGSLDSRFGNLDREVVKMKCKTNDERTWPNGRPGKPDAY